MKEVSIRTRAPVTLELLRWHRRVGTLACGALMLWSLSGILHPLISRLQPQPATRTAPAVVLPSPTAPTLAAILGRAGLRAVSEARLVQTAQGSAWRVEPVDSRRQARYFKAADGIEIIDGEREHAVFLGRHFVADEHSAIRSVTRIARFGGAYTYVNRLLPVFCVNFAREDEMQVYVDTRQAALATLVDRRKAMLSRLFTGLHTWSFLTGTGPSRVALVSFFLMTVLLAPALGLAVGQRRRGVRLQGVRYWHRRLGLVIAAIVLCSAGSGFWHLQRGTRNREDPAAGPPRASQVLPAEDLDTHAVANSEKAQSLVLLEEAGRIHARMTPLAAFSDPPAGAHHHAAARDTPTLPAARYLPLLASGAALDELSYARHLAQRMAGAALPLDEGTPVTAFDADYGFVNKLLPVIRFRAGSTLLYVHTETRSLAALTTPSDRAEGWVFAQLHKWQGLEPLLGRDLRDLLQVAGALASALVALMGLRLLSRQPRQAGKN